MTKKKGQPVRRHPFGKTGSRAVDDFANQSVLDSTDAIAAEQVRNAMDNLQKKQAERRRSRLILDLSRYSEYELPERVERLAEIHGVPASHIIALLIKQGLDDIEAGKLHLEDFYISNDHPRIKRALILEKQN